MKTNFKKQHIRLFLTLVSTTIFFNSGLGQCVSGTCKEDTLYLETVTISEAEASDEKDHGINYITLGGNTIPTLVSTISAEAISSLKKIATNTHTNDPYCPNFFTGLKITLGAQGSSPQMLLLFQPVYLCRTNATAAKDATFQVTWVSPVSYTYNVDAQNFTVISPANFDDIYQGSLRIDRYFWPFDRDFRPMMDATGDARSLVYPFQEIDSVLISNAVQAINIYSVAHRNQPYGSVTYTKHSMLLGPEGTNKKTGELFYSNNKISSFRGFHADRANLCPPDCDEVFYKLYSKTDKVLKEN